MKNGVRNYWTKSETIIVLRLYVLISVDQIDEPDEEIRCTAALLNKTVRAIRQKMANMATLEPGHVAVEGASYTARASALDIRVWKEYSHDRSNLDHAADEKLDNLISWLVRYNAYKLPERLPRRKK